MYFHTTKSKHKEPKIGMSIKNKSGKRRLSGGGGLTSKTPTNPCVYLVTNYTCLR